MLFVPSTKSHPETANPPVALATVIFPVQSKETPQIVLALVSLGADTIVITGVVV